MGQQDNYQRISNRLHVGEVVFDRDAEVIGRVTRVRSPDPLAVADDGRRIGHGGDLAAILPGYRALRSVSPRVAAALVRAGYITVAVRGGMHARLAALTDIDYVDGDGIHLAVAAKDLATLD